MGSFYHYFRPLAVLGKIMCSFPIENALSSDPFKLRYKRCSISFLYPILTQYGLILFLIVTTSPQLKFASLPKQFLVILVIFMALRSTISFTFTLFIHAKRMPHLIQLLHLFEDLWQERVGKNKKCWWFLIVRVAGPFITYFVLVTFYTYGTVVSIKEISPERTLQGKSKLVAFLIGLLASWYIAPMFYFIYFSSVICKGFGLINSSLISMHYQGDYHRLFGEGRKLDFKEVAKLRYLHSMLAAATNELSKCFGSFLAIEKIFNVVTIVGNLSCFIYDSTHCVYLVILTMVNMFLAASAVQLGEKIKRKGVKVVRLFQGIPTSDLSEKSKEEIQLWLLQLTAHPIHVNAGGYFILDKGQTFEALSSIATYLIVAVQLLQDGKFS